VVLKEHGKQIPRMTVIMQREETLMRTKANFHANAARLIVTAAEKSGLLQEIAQALRFVDQTHYEMPDGTVAREFCFACELRTALIEAFEIDDHASLVSNLLEAFHGEGFGRVGSWRGPGFE
jgi:hypothetical protein